MEILAMKRIYDSRTLNRHDVRRRHYAGLLQRDDQSVIPFEWGWHETKEGNGVWEFGSSGSKLLPEKEYMFVLYNLGRSVAVCRDIPDEDGVYSAPEAPVIPETHTDLPGIKMI